MLFRRLLPHLVAFLVTWIICNGAHDDMKLELVQAIFRHAKRTPFLDEVEYIGVHDPTMYEPPDFYKLTNDGKKQSYEYGRLLRKEYMQFLGPYDPKNMYALSSNFDCPKMSLQLVLAALYSPLSAEEKWHHNLDWRPRTVYYNNGRLDLELTTMLAPNYLILYDEEMSKTNEHPEFMRKYADFIHYLEESSGISMNTTFLRKCSRFFTVTQIHSMMNLPLPAWCTNDTVAKLEELFKYALRSLSFTQKLNRNSGGPLVRTTVRNAIAGDAHRKIYLYACHELTIAAFAHAQNITLPFEIPPYASSIIMEKHKGAGGRAYVRARSWNGSDGSFVTLRIADCDEFCPMEKYLRIVEGVIPSDEELEYLSAA